MTKVTLFLIFGVIVLFIASIVLLFFKSPGTEKPTTMTTQPTTPVNSMQNKNISPAQAPLTQQNVDNALSNIDTDIQNSLNQENKDLNSVSQIDTSADNQSL